MSDTANRMRSLAAAVSSENGGVPYQPVFPSTLLGWADEIETLREDFAKLRLGICDHATDTVWVDERGTTAVDFISIILDDGDWYNETYLPSKEDLK